MAKKKAVSGDRKQLEKLREQLKEVEKHSVALDDLLNYAKWDLAAVLDDLKQFAKDVPKEIDSKPALQELQAIFKGIKDVAKEESKVYKKKWSDLEKQSQKLAKQLEQG